jgi:hypothetical protein
LRVDDIGGDDQGRANNECDEYVTEVHDYIGW